MMKRHFVFLILLFLFQRAVCQERVAPYGMMVEFIRDTRGVPILDLAPEFNWNVPSAADKQTACQLLVASSAKMLEGNTGDIWDSGKMIVTRSTAVEYGGKALLPLSGYFWKVRIWDEKGNPSPWSGIMSFRTGNPKDYSTTRNRFIYEIDKPVSFYTNEDGNLFADFGRDAFGTLVLSLENVTNDTISIHLGEKLDNDGRIDRKPGGTIRYAGIKIPASGRTREYVLKLKPDQRNTGPAAVILPDSVGVVMPFRYCEIGNLAPNPEMADIKRRSLFYNFDYSESSFSSSDKLLDSIWDICKYSIKATSFAGIYVDGDRERIAYEADAYINQLGHYYTDREYSIARLTNEYFMNHPTWPTEWILHTVPMFWYDYMFTGDAESMRQHYEGLKHKTLEALARPDGLISSKNCTPAIMKSLGFTDPKTALRDIVDWPPAQKDTGWKLATAEGERDGYEMKDLNTVVNAFYYNSLIKMSDIAGWLGKDADKEKYRLLAEKVLERFNSVFLDPQSGIYTDGEGSRHSSLHANMMPLAFGMVPPGNLQKVIAFVKSRGMACSVYGAQYLLEGLYRYGEQEHALTLLTSEGDRGWWNMIRSGSTITMEAWDMKYKPNSDWNHAWGAAPANIIPGFMWGIFPSAPGFEKTIIRPQTASLTASTVTVPTIRGSITADFRKTESGLIYEITVPGNMECEFVIPGKGNYAALLNNKKIGKDAGILKLKPGKNIIVLTKKA